MNNPMTPLDFSLGVCYNHPTKEKEDIAMSVTIGLKGRAETTVDHTNTAQAA